MKIDITLKSGRSFPEHQPVRLEYYMGFMNKADFVIYDISLYENLDIPATEEFTIDAQPSDGVAFKFVGVLYDIKMLSRSKKHMRLHFISKYYKKLVSAVPLYGKGKVSDIIESFYRKAGIATIEKDESVTSMDNVLFPRTTTIDDAITYLLNRALTTDGYLLSTIVGNVAYIRNIKNGKQDISGIFYRLEKIIDNRRRVDMLGGVKVKMVSDAKDVKELEHMKSGLNEVEKRLFYGMDNAVVDKARSKVAQNKVYFSNYTAVISLPGWIPMFGSNLVVKKGDIHEQKIVRALDWGKYFVNSQVLVMDYADKSLESSHCGIQLVGEV